MSCAPYTSYVIIVLYCFLLRRTVAMYVPTYNTLHLNSSLICCLQCMVSMFGCCIHYLVWLCSQILSSLPVVSDLRQANLITSRSSILNEPADVVSLQSSYSPEVVFKIAEVLSRHGFEKESNLLSGIDRHTHAFTSWLVLCYTNNFIDNFDMSLCVFTISPQWEQCPNLRILFNLLV